jgi:hypothetical protein
VLRGSCGQVRRNEELVLSVPNLAAPNGDAGSGTTARADSATTYLDTWCR